MAISLKLAIGTKLRHPGMLDLDIHVAGNVQETKDGIKFTAKYWHRDYRGYLDVMDTVEIKRKDFDKWLVL